MTRIPSEITERRSDWKVQHGEIFYLPVGEGFVLRPFTLGEFKKYILLRTSDPIDAETWIVQTCLLWPEEFDVEDLSQGDFEILSQKLLDVSPFDNHDRLMEKLDQSRELAESLHNAIYIHIAAAFPAMTLDMIDLLNPDKLIHMLALAEKILQRPVEIEGEGKAAPPSPTTPEEVRVLHAQAAIARKEMRKRRVQVAQAEAAGMPVPDISTNPQHLNLMKDMRDMQKLGLGPPPDAGP